MAAFVQRIRCEAPASVLPGNYRTQYRVAVIDRDCGARLGGTAQGRRVIIRYVAAVQCTRVFSCIISHLQIADRSHDCIHRQLKRRGTLADVPGLVGHGGAQAVAAFIQCIRGVAPASVLTGNHRTQHRVAVIDRDRGARLGGTAQGRRGVVGQIAAGQRAGMPGHIVGHQQIADRSHDCIHRQLKRRGTLADVSGLVGHGGAQAVAAFIQCIRGVTPASVLPGNHGTQHRVAVVDRDCGPRLGGTAQGRRGVVGQIAAGQRACMPGHVVGHQQIADRSHDCVHRQLKRRGTLADVPGLVGHGGAQAVAAFIQCIRGVAPASVLTGNHRTQHRVAVIDRDRGPRLGGTAQGRRGIVGQIAAGQRAGMPGHIVGHLQIADRSHRRVHCNFKCRGTLADVPRLVRHGGAQAVVALVQGVRREAPASVLPGNHRTQYGVAVVDRDCGPRLGGTAQGRRGIVGQIAAGQRAGMPGHIVGHLQIADRSHRRVHCNFKCRGTLADVPRLVRHGGAQAVVALVQGVRREAPASVLPGNHRTQYGVAVVDRDCGPRLGGTAQGRRGIVGQIAAGQRAGVPGHIVGHLQIADRSHRRVHCNFKRRGTLADVPRLVRHGGAQAVVALVQGVRREAPASVLPGNHRTQYGVAVVDRDCGPRLGGTAQGRRGVVGQIAAGQGAGVPGHIVGHLQIADRSHNCIHRQLKRRGTLADVPGLVRHRGAQAVVALVQGIRREAPASVLPGNHRTQYGVAVVDRDCGPRLGGTAQGRRGVVGQIAAGQGAGVPGHIVGHLQIADRSHNCIHRQLKRRGTLADVPGLVRHRGAQAVVALVQGIRREAPASVFPGNHRTQYGVTVIDGHRGPHLGGTAQGRRGIVGQIAAGQRAGVPGHVVGHLRRTGRRRGGINHQLKRRGTLTDIPGLVRHRSAQAMRTFAKLR
ncbi:Scorpion calcine family protein [Klebsiella oxytoca]|uniref:Scorpion calcine family protein n=1 Tax=Klebsiella oxytoca TaxID=571 RepID=A0A6N3H917_KLEOX